MTLKKHTTMEQEKLSTDQLFNLLDKTSSELQGIISSYNEKEINTVPVKGSWTAAQVADHLIKSNNSIGKALAIHSLQTRADADARKDELKNQFLDFTIKFQSPDFILPDKNYYEQGELMEDLFHSFKNLHEKSSHTDLSESINHPAFGEITKLELIYFVWYHTQRHLRQLKNIFQILKTKNNESSKSLFKL